MAAISTAGLPCLYLVWISQTERPSEVSALVDLEQVAAAEQEAREVLAAMPTVAFRQAWARVSRLESELKSASVLAAAAAVAVRAAWEAPDWAVQVPEEMQVGESTAIL